jgi:F0F1-type ATP synthase epsilon subunit
MPVINGDMIEVLTDQAEFQRYINNYRALQRAKKAYYERNKEAILAKKREKYAASKVVAATPDVQSI